MAKRSHASQHNKKTERLSYLVAGLLLLFIALMVVAADTDHPQLEPVRRLTDSCKSGLDSVYYENPHLTPVRNLTTSLERELSSAYQTNPQLEPIKKLIRSFKGEAGGLWLSMGETGETNGLSITLVSGELNEGYSLQTGSDLEAPPAGAKFLFLYLKVENVGKVKERFPCSFTDRFFGGNDIAVVYADTKMPQHQIKPSREYTPVYLVHYGDERYPGQSEEGWIAFEVPAGIELDETTCKVMDLVWRLEEEKIIIRNK